LHRLSQRHGSDGGSLRLLRLRHDGRPHRLHARPGAAQVPDQREHLPFGYVTTDDGWENYWRSGPISLLGWRGTEASGFGAKSLGREVAASRAFSVCQVEKAFKYTCFRPVGSPDDRLAVEQIADRFETQGYSMKRVLAETAAYCMGN